MNNSIVWLTGVSGVGKTTIANALKEEVVFGRYSQRIILDADECRKLWPELSLSTKDRKINILRIGNIAKILDKQLINSLIIVACIAPYKKERDEILKIRPELLKERSFLIYLHAPLSIRMSRDPKGLYKKAVSGEIDNLTGYNGTYEIPTNAFLSFDTSEMKPLQIAEIIMKEIC